MAMKAEERLKIIFEKKTTCPICAGTGEDPIQRSHKGPEPAPCRRCVGKCEISRLQTMNADTHPEEQIILREEVRKNGALVTHFQPLSDFAEQHREILERSQSGLTNRKRLQEIKPGVCQVMRNCIDAWIGEGRV